jgi:hypothetical protein
MRTVGIERLRDSRIQWLAECPESTEAFDRIVCGAAIWQFLPLDRTFERLSRLLAPGGALSFNIPALYLGMADQPGGGRDPHLQELAVHLIDGCPPPAATTDVLPSPDGIDALLAAAGLVPSRWSFRTRLTQPAYRDWLKVPPMTNGWLRGLAAEERARRIDRAYRRVDPDSWRWEAWAGWTAWKA